ncbi:MAG: Flp family type IVb pilin [Pseudonocardiales bacterium]|nr:MAG: Flp family type IVb pilin [Pseudonocardiales bacterium]
MAALVGRLRPAGERDRGATATEYGLLVAFIAIAIVLGITAFGSQLNTWYSNLAALIPS